MASKITSVSIAQDDTFSAKVRDFVLMDLAEKPWTHPWTQFGHRQIKKACVLTQAFEKYGAPERIRTSDLCLRRAALYPAELRAHSKPRITRQFRVRNLTCAGGVCPAPELNSSLRFSAFSVRE